MNGQPNWAALLAQDLRLLAIRHYAPAEYFADPLAFYAQNNLWC